jgi:Arc-like DNA binding domain
MAAKPKEGPHLRVRLPPKMLERLEKSREKEGRTLTGEIVHRIDESFRRDTTREQIAAMGAMIADLMIDVASGATSDKTTLQARIEEVVGKVARGEKS